jgi:Uma2 family endonuclease
MAWRTSANRSLAATAEVHYPSSDGKPVGETDFHILALMYLRYALQYYFRDQPDTYVATDMFLYYVQGDPSANKAPDVMIVKGVSKRLRRSFKVWEEQAGPCVIIELASENSWREDLYEKPPLYRQLGVREYFVFDPEDKYLHPQLQGFRRKGRRFVAMKAEPDGSLGSELLGLRLVPEQHLLRLVDVQTGRPLLTPDEQADLAEQERKRAEAAEAELARLRAAARRRKKKPKP